MAICKKRYLWNEKFSNYKRILESGNIVSKKNNPSLYYWVNYQRSLYRVGKLSSDKLGLLNGIKGFVLNREVRFKNNIYRIIDFINENGHCKTIHNTSLYNAIHHIKRMYNCGKLTNKQCELLSKITHLDWVKVIS